MALPDNNINVTLVRNTINETSFSVGELCTSPKMNIYSRYRPGYWYISSGYLSFRYLRGGNTTDPRGYNIDTGLNVEAGNLGDFRGYNHSAYRFYVPVPEIEIPVPSNQTGTISVTVVFDIGEIDFFNEDNIYRSKNVIGYEYLCSIMDNSIIALSHKDDLEVSGNYRRMEITLDLDASSTKVYTIYLGFSDGYGHINARFPDDVYKKITITKLNPPMWYINMLESDLPALKNSLSGLLSSDVNNSIYRVYFTPESGTLTPYSTTLSAKFSTQIIMANTFNTYDVTQLRWYVGGRIEVYDPAINLVSTQQFTSTMSMGADMAHTLNLTLNSQAIDGYIYRIYFTTFTTTGVSPT